MAMTLPLFLLGLGNRDIWIPLEARYALVAREMWEKGHWILPHLGGQIYPDKPPLLFWGIALFSTVASGVTEWTARLPSALAAVSLCLMVWRMGRQLFAPDAGVLAALVLATSAGFFWSGRQVLPDMLLTLWTTGASWAFWEWLVARHRLGAPIAGVCMALATLTKGPVGFLLPSLATLVYFTIRGDWRRLQPRDVMLCGGVFLGVTLAWYLPAIWQGGVAYVQATLLHHSLERYIDAWEHKAPSYFYLWAFPAEFLPWTLFLLPALICGLRYYRQGAREGCWFALCWLVTVLLFFSLSTGKRDIYILPAYPAAALLVSSLWSRQWARQVARPHPWRLSALILALGLWGLAGGLWAAVEGLLPSKSTLLLPDAPEMRVWTGILLVLGGIVVASAAIVQHPRLGFGSILGCTWLAMLMASTWIYTPQFNRRYPIKAFAATIRARVEPSSPLSLCGPMNDLAVRFNVGRLLPALLDDAEIFRYLATEGEVFCVIDLAHYRRLSIQAGHRLPVLVRQDFDRSALLLISNRP